jgi:phage tail sheath gpL-like
MGLDTGIGQFRSGFTRYCVDPTGNTDRPQCAHRIIAQKLASGTATSGQTYTVYDSVTAKTLFGAGSIAAIMAAIHFCIAPDSPVYVTPIDDPSGSVAATFTWTVAGPATAGGSINFNIWPRSYSVNVVAGDSATAIATAIAAIVNGDADSRFSASSALGVVTFTAKNKGTVGNHFVPVVSPLFGQSLPAGVTLTLASGTAGSGAVPAGTISALLDECCYTCYSLGVYDPAPIAEFGTYFSPLTGTWSCGNMTCLGHLFVAKPYASVGAFIAEVETFNRESLTLINSPSSLWIPPFAVSSAWAARNCVGACEDPARPVVRDNGLLSCLTLGSVCKGLFTRAEKEAMYAAGGAYFEVSNTSGFADTVLWIEANITTYKKDALGRPDKTWTEVATRHTVSLFLTELDRFYKDNYLSVGLVNNGTPIPVGRKAVNANIVKAGLEGWARQFLGILIDSDSDLDGVFRVARNTDGQPNCYGDPNRLDVKVKLDVVNQLLRIATNVNVLLQTNCQTNRVSSLI